MSDGELQQLLDRFWEVAKNTGDRYALVLDLSIAPPMPPRQRQLLTDQMRAAEGELAIDCVGTALVFRSPLMRGLLTAIFWLFKPPYPTRAFASADPARAWLQALLGQSAAQTGD